MKIIRNKFIPFPGYKAINLFGVLFVSISFDREAYENDVNPEYLSKRNRFEWVKYLKK